MRKRALIWLIAIVLAIILSIMGTIAYLTDVKRVTNVMTIGNVDIELLEYERENVDTKGDGAKVQAFHDDKLLYPAVLKDGFDYSNPTALVDWEQIGWKQNDATEYQSNIWDPGLINNEVDKMVFVRNTSNYDAYVRIFFAFEAGAYTNLNQFNEKVHLNLNTTDWTWEWDEYIAKRGNSKFFIAVATYKTPLKAWSYTEISLSQIALDPIATKVDVDAFGTHFDVPIFAQAIQSASFGDPKTALETGFGSDIPFPDMTIYRGEELKIALNNFEANITNPEKITAKVTRVIFGTKDEYPNIVNDKTLTPTLTLNEYDTPTGKEWGAPVHTYYVPDGENYKLYVLADEGAVYAPKICDSLFKEMVALTDVYAANLDVKYTTNMAMMFKGCSNLVTLEGTENWDVSKVTTMSLMFSGCQKLAALDVSKWKTNSLTDASFLFNSCASLGTLDVSSWKVDNVTNMNAMFSGCKALDTLNVSQWNVGNVQEMNATFSGCSALKSLDVSGWNVENVNNFTEMFKNCSVLTSLDVSEWKTSKATLMGSMFYYCENLAILDVSKWDVGTVTAMNLMFFKCTALAKLELSSWDTSNVTTMASMFNSCSSLAELDTSKWKTANVTTMENMFFGCSALEEIDVSKWKTANVTTMQNMFSGCSALEEIDVSSWDTSKVTTMQSMFQNCLNLMNIDVSSWDTSKVTTMQNMFYQCKTMTKLEASNWNTSKVTTMANMFQFCNGLTEIDALNWDTSKVLDSESMFAHCTNLTTIYVGNNWSMVQVVYRPEDKEQKIEKLSSENMFTGCTSLVGGSGTEFSSSNPTDKTYAIIDGGTSNPGYLTQGPAPTTP